MPQRVDATKSAPPEVSDAARRLALSLAEKYAREDHPERARKKSATKEEDGTALARRLAISQPSVSRFLRGAGLGMPMLFALHRHTGLSLDEICGLRSQVKPAELDNWELARLCLRGAVTPAALSFARERAQGRTPPPLECVSMLMDAQRDLLAPDDDTYIRAKKG